MKITNPKLILSCLLTLFMGISLQAQVVKGLKKTGESAADRDTIYVLSTGALTGYPNMNPTGELILAPAIGTLKTDSLTATSIYVQVPVITIGCAVPTVTICAYTTANYSGTPICVVSPTITNDTISGKLTGLLGNVTYYLRVIATNAGGNDTVTGSATTLCPTIPRTTCTVTARNASVENGQSNTSIDSVKDHEGNYYDVVQIGDQCWLKENMRCKTSPSTGTRIMDVPATSYSYAGKKAYYYNNDSTTYLAKYGVLYNWCAAVDSFNTALSGATETQTVTDYNNALDVTFSGNRRGICPEGWHLPSDAEWTTMTNAAHCGTDSATVLAGGCDWSSSTTGNAPGNYNNARRNATLFSVLPSGGFFGSFSNAGNYAAFWSSTRGSGGNAYYRYLGYGNAEVYRNGNYKNYGFSVRCLRDVITASELGTMSIDSITPTTMNVKVPITATGGETPTATICAYTNAAYTAGEICVTTPTIANDTISGKLTGLLGNVTYYLRVIATNAGGNDTVTGSATTLKTCAYIPRTTCTVAAINTAVENGPSNTSIDSVKDHEGNYYDVVQIGNQCWLKENMRCKTSPSTGTRIMDVPATSYSYAGKKAYYYNNDSTTYLAKYGVLYNWCAAVDSFNTALSGATETQTVTSSSQALDVTFSGNRRGICPEGWHLPSDAEWTTMEIAAGIGDSATLASTSWRGDSATVLAGGCDWTSSTTGNAPGNYDNARRNATLFSVLPSGYYYGSFNYAGNYAYFWSSTRGSGYYAYYRYLGCNDAVVYRNYYAKNLGFSVRCVRD